MYDSLISIDLEMEWDGNKDGFDMDAVHFVIFDTDLYMPSSLNLIIAANITYCR
jgi:hypothetical protein